MAWNKGRIIKGFKYCLFCGKQFIRWKTSAKFCSRSCSSSAQKGKIVSCSTREKLRKSHIGRILPEDQKRRIGIKSLGHKLSAASKLKISLSKRGEKSSSWRGGVSSDNELYRKRAEYKLWRSDVFCRDDFTCLSCGVRGGHLEAHHIKYFSEFPELRFELNNGKTLCKVCHKREHYGMES